MESENKVLVKFKSGKLEPFYRYYYAGFVLFARNFLGKDEDYLSEDMVQNAIMKAWESRDSFESLIALKSYVYVSVKNNILNHKRKKLNEESYLRQLQDSEDFENTLIEREAYTLLYNAIQALPDKYRELFELYYLEGKTNKEISLQLDIPERTLKRYKAECIAILKEKLSKHKFYLLFYYLRKNN